MLFSCIFEKGEYIIDVSPFQNHKVSAYRISFIFSQPAFTCSKLTKETLEQWVKYVQS